MNTYIILIRGINVGGKNKVSMAALKEHLIEAGFSNVITYINSGNVIIRSDKSPKIIKDISEKILIDHFASDAEPIKVLVLTHKELETIIKNKPKNFGESPEKYHSDAVFVIDIPTSDALAVFDPREGIDMIWPGNGVVYSQRLSAERTKSRLNKIIGTPAYKSMTIRNWNTTTKLLELAEATFEQAS